MMGIYSFNIMHSIVNTYHQFFKINNRQLATCNKYITRLRADTFLLFRHLLYIYIYIYQNQCLYPPVHA